MSADEFGPFDGRVWLNTAHHGPLPRVAAEAARRAIAEKVNPVRIADGGFLSLPLELKRALARLIGADPTEIVLGNSTSYGLHLLANGLALNDGDEVLLVDGDFPATVFPWLPLRLRGVRVRLLQPGQRPLSAEQLAAELTPRTRVFCSSWVFSFTGEAIDLDALGSVCRERDVDFVVNGSQAVGTRELDVRSTPIDALVSCGFKWLCGPYGTGFAWLRPELAERVDYQRSYWLAHTPRDDLGGRVRYSERDDLGVARYDVFCTANFLNFAPWLASVTLIGERGCERIAAANQELVGRLVEGLADTELELVSPAAGDQRSTLVLARHPRAERTAELHRELLASGIDVALRNESIRFAPHLHNTAADIDRALEAVRSGSSL